MTTRTKTTFSSRILRLVLGILLGLPLACSDKTGPIRRLKKKNTAPKKERTFNPDRPGPSSAAKAIGQAMHIKRGEDALARRQPGEALDHLRKALAELPGSPRSAEIHLLMGQAHELLGRPEQALAAFEKGVALAPTNPSGHYLLALTYKSRRRYDEAHKRMVQAITLAPARLVFRFDLVTIELAQGRKQAADKSFRQYEKLRSDLIARLRAGEERQRLAALRELGSVLSDEVNVAAIATLIPNRSAALRTAAARAIGESATRKTGIRQALTRQLARETDDGAREALRQALARLPTDATPRGEPSK